MTIIKASDFTKRSALEAHIGELGLLNTNPKSDYQIKGKEKDLSRLHLSYKSIFWGIPCVATNKKEEVKTDRPNRGTIHQFGLNGNNLKKPKSK